MPGDIIVKRTFYGAFAFALLIAFFVLFWKQAQTNALQNESTTQACTDVTYLMGQNITPSQVLRDGGVLQSGTNATGDIAENDLGELWTLPVSEGGGSLEVTFRDLPVDIPLEFALFKGLERIGEQKTVIVANHSYILSAPLGGVYTLVVRMSHEAQLEGLRSQTYTVTVRFPDTGDVQAGIQPVTDTNRHAIESVMFDTSQGLQTYSALNNARVRFHANSLTRISLAVPDRLHLTDEGANGRLVLGQWAQQVDLVGGDLSIVPGENAAQLTTFYLQDYGYATINEQTDLRSFKDSYNSLINIDWDRIRGVWMMRDCIGVSLLDGRLFTATIDPTNPRRDMNLSGRDEKTRYPCEEFYISLKALTPDQTSAEHQLCIDWGDGINTGVLAGKSIDLIDGVLTTHLVGDRDLAVQGTFIDFAPLSLPVETSAGPVKITVGKVPASQVNIQLDWVHLKAFRLTDDVAFTFMDDPVRDGQTTARSAANIATIEALDDVIQLIYRDDTQRMILPADDGYIEIVKSSPTPLFVGAPFDGRALPNTPGYGPRGANNLGNECFQVNTLLKELNCAGNGDINPANGNFWYSVTDLDVYHPRMTLTLNRSYNSASATLDSAFGFGWTSNYPIDYKADYDATSLARPIDTGSGSVSYYAALNVTWASEDVVTYTTSSGSQHTFIKSSGVDADTYTGLTMPGWILSREGANRIAWARSQWTLRRDDGFTAIFDRAGRLRSYGYPAQSYAVSINYDEASINGLNGQTVTITDSVNTRQLVLVYNSDSHIVLSQIRDLTQSQEDACATTQNCFEVSYEYIDGFLTTVTYPNGQKAHYGYDQGRLIVLEDPRSPTIPVMGIQYAGEETRLRVLAPGETQPNDASPLYQSVKMTTEGEARVAVVTDVRGLTQTYRYALDTGSLKEAGKSYQLLSRSQFLDDVDPLARRPQVYTWSDNKLVLEEIAGRSQSTFSFGAAGHLAEIHGNYPKFKINTPDSQSLPESVSFSDTGSMRYSYTSSGLLETFISKEGMTYTYTYDNAGTLTELTRSDGVSWIYTYTENMPGFIHTLTQSSRAADDSGYSIAYTWDGLGRLIGLEDSILGLYTIAYDMANPNANFNSTVTMTDPSNSVITVVFDAYQRMIEQQTTAPKQDDIVSVVRSTSYIYNDPLIDPLQRLASTTAHNIAADGTALEPQITRYAYTYEDSLNVPPDDDTANDVIIRGTRVTVTDPYNRDSYTVVDALGRLRLVGDYSLSETRYDYGIEDASVDQYPENGITITQTDYLAGKQIAGARYTFNTDWQLVSVFRSEGGPQAESTWQGKWQFFPAVIGQSDWISRYRQFTFDDIDFGSIVWSDDSEATLYQNDKPKSLALLRNPNQGAGVVRNMQVTYDTLGRVVSVANPVENNLQVMTLTYCNLPQGGVKVIRSAPQPALTPLYWNQLGDLALTYDVHQRLTSVEDHFGQRTFTYAPDLESGGLKVTVNSGPLVWTLLYNAAGDLTQWRDESNFTRTYTRDSLGRLVAIQVAGVPEASFRFTYNNANLLTKQVDELGRGTAYSYDEKGHLTLEQNILTSDLTTYTYNAQGLLNSVISPLGNVTSYRYDENGANPRRIKEIITPAGRHKFDWYDSNNKIVYTDPLGHETTYLYDSLGLLWSIVSPQGRTSHLRWDISSQLVEWLTTEKDAQRDLTFAYEPNSHLITLAETSLPQWGWTFDLAADGALEQILNSADNPLDVSYDPLGRVEVLGTGQDSFRWTFERASEATLNITDGYGTTTTATYDAAYRQLSAQKGDANVTYNYAERDEGIVNLLVTTQQEADQPQVRLYIFAPGDTFITPRIVVHTPGQRVDYLYNIEGQLEAITQQVCLQAPFVPVTNELTINDSPCPESVSPDSIWRTTLRFGYTNSGQPSRSVDEEQNTETFAYDSNKNLINYQTKDGKTFTYRYDDLNRLERLQTPAGIDLILSYRLDRVSGICQNFTSQNVPDYAACETQGGVLETYHYDALGRVVQVNYPNGAMVPFLYDASGAGQLTQRGSLSIRYGNNGLALVDQIGTQAIERESIDQIQSVQSDQNEALEFQYDDLDRIQHISDGEQILTFTYTTDGFQIAADETVFHVGLAENGLIQRVSMGENQENLSIPQFKQEDGTLLRFNLFWNQFDINILYTVDRTGRITSLRYDRLDFIYGVTPSGLVRKESIIGDQSYFVTTVDNATTGYVIATSYDQNDRPLTIRVNDQGSERLFYQATFVYSDCGRLQRETRLYQDETQVEIDYVYGDAGPRQCNAAQTQLQSRVVTLNPKEGETITRTVVYEYDALGNVRYIKKENETAEADSKICVSYSYDAANRLQSVMSGDNLTSFEYDAYNRLTRAGSRRYMYLGDFPVAIVDGDSTEYSLYTSEGVLLLRSTNGLSSTVIANGQNRIYGIQSASGDTNTPAPLWIFDSFARYLDFQAPQLNDEPCDLLRIKDIPVSVQPYSDRIWDAATNLFFFQGRSYSPESAIFLQPNPNGLDAQGSVYDLTVTQPYPPRVREAHSSYGEGLHLLQSALESQHRAELLSDQAVERQFAPLPAGMGDSSFGQSLQTPSQDARDRLRNVLGLPAWLASQYNLPSPYFDAKTGGLSLFTTNAPGQTQGLSSGGGDFSDPIWQTNPIWTPLSMSTTLDRFTQIASHTPAVTRGYIDYLPHAWQGDVFQLADVWTPPTNLAAVDVQPSDLLPYLPRPLYHYEDSLLLVETLNNLNQAVMKTGRDWFDEIYTATVPHLPETLPTVESWRDTFFSSDTFYLQENLNPIFLPDYPKLDFDLFHIGS